jgi:hypothetical protein
MLLRFLPIPHGVLKDINALIAQYLTEHDRRILFESQGGIFATYSRAWYYLSQRDTMRLERAHAGGVIEDQYIFNRAVEFDMCGYVARRQHMIVNNTIAHARSTRMCNLVYRGYVPNKMHPSTHKWLADRKIECIGMIWDTEVKYCTDTCCFRVTGNQELSNMWGGVFVDAILESDIERWKLEVLQRKLGKIPTWKSLHSHICRDNKERRKIAECTRVLMESDYN